MWVFRPHAISSAFMHAFKHGMIIHRATLLSTKSPEEDRSPLKILRGGPLAPLTPDLDTLEVPAAPRRERDDEIEAALDDAFGLGDEEIADKDDDAFEEEALEEDRARSRFG